MHFKPRSIVSYIDNYGYVDLCVVAFTRQMVREKLIDEVKEGVSINCSNEPQTPLTTTMTI